MKCWQLVREWPLTIHKARKAPRAQLAHLWCLPLLALLLFHAPRAHADSSVVVLGVRSLDGDDDLARQVSRALRDGAKTVPTWKISDRDVSLAQMSLAHGCEEPDARCMADIARTLEVDRLIYGTMSRNDSQMDVALFNFDAVTGQVETSITEKVPSDALVGVALKGTAAALAKRLAGIEPTGALRVRSDAPGARVLLDNKDIGMLDARGELLLAGIAVGTHNLRVEKAADKASQSIEIREAETTTAQPKLAGAGLVAGSEPAPGPKEESKASAPTRHNPANLRRILGWSAVGVAGALLVGTAYTWVRIDRINDSGDLANYRDRFSKSSNVCDEAHAGTLQKTNNKYKPLEDSAANLCDEADTLEILQYVFLGGALAAGGVGAYLLLTDKPAGAKHSLLLQPHLARGRGTLSATFRF